MAGKRSLQLAVLGFAVAALVIFAASSGYRVGKDIAMQENDRAVAVKSVVRQ